MLGLTVGYFLWPEDIESPWAVGFRLQSQIHRLTSILSRTSRRLSSRLTKRNQSWSMAWMRSPKHQVPPMDGVCLELISPIWSIIVAMSRLCFLEQTPLSLFFSTYVRRNTYFVKRCMNSACRGLCKRNNISRFNNYFDCWFDLKRSNFPTAYIIIPWCDKIS